MNPTSYDLNSSSGNIQMSEAILETNSNQPLTTTNDIDITNEEKHLLSNQDNSSSNPIDNIPFETSPLPSNIPKKQKSLVSVYDNSNDGEQQQQQTNEKNFPLIGILGRNQRSKAFTKRLLLSGFPNPILCDINSNEIYINDKLNYVSYEIFYQQSPSIIIITDNLKTNIQFLLNQNNQQLIIDARELINKYFSKKNSHLLLKSIPESYQAFGNLSNWEIENGTQRVSVAIEQSSPLNLIKFIYDLNCFTRGIYFLDKYSYNNKQIKSFRNCLFPFISTIIIFTLCFILSIIEYKTIENYYKLEYIYYQASSITATTSLILLSLLFFIRPIIEIIEFILKKQQNNQYHIVKSLIFIQRWLQSRKYLAWYSLSFAFLHLILIIFLKNDFNQKIFFYPVFFGLVTLIILCILSFVYFPWISERLLWHEYYLLTSYLGPFCLLIAFIHVFIHWKYDYYYNTNKKNLFTLKFLSMFLPFIVLLLRFIIYGIIYPIIKLTKWIENHQKKPQILTKIKIDTSILP